MTNKNIILTIIIVVVVASVIYFLNQEKSKFVVSSFDQCLKAGFPILESHPRKCVDGKGNTFTETTDNNFTSNNPVLLNNLDDNDMVTSPLTVTGEARGYWFFEASFPVVVTDDSKNPIYTGIAEAQKDWMTTSLVPFTVTLNFVPPKSKTGFIIFKKDNPSGLPENDGEVIIPVQFKTTSTSTKACIPGGCSGQLCIEEGSDDVSTCEFKAEYACYKNAVCSRNSTGQCAWEETATLKACLQNPPTL